MEELKRNVNNLVKRKFLKNSPRLYKIGYLFDNYLDWPHLQFTTKNYFLGISQYAENDNTGGKHEKLK